MKWMKTAGIVVLLIQLWGCATTKVADVTPGYKPGDEKSDEAGLWHQVERAEQQIANSPARVRDAALEKYLSELTCRLAADLCADVRIYVLAEPHFNAFMMPNGAMMIFTGALLRIENEAQLAAVIGHEIGHFRSKHSLENWRKMKNTGTLLTSIGAIAGGTAANLVVVVGAYANLASFSRDQEREADQAGFDALKRVGLDTRGPGQLWSAIWEEEKVNPPGFLSGIFATHPASEERRDRLTKQGLPASGETGSERYRGVVQALQSGWLADELSRRNYAQSAVLLDRLAQSRKNSALIHRFRGELFRKRGKPGDLERAVLAYQAAAKLGDVEAEVFRDLGTSLRRLDRHQEASSAFKEYLTRKPEAADAAVIRSYIQ